MKKPEEIIQRFIVISDVSASFMVHMGGKSVDLAAHLRKWILIFARKELGDWRAITKCVVAFHYFVQWCGGTGITLTPEVLKQVLGCFDMLFGEEDLSDYFETFLRWVARREKIDENTLFPQ